jgi:hypothetical protein
VLLCQARLLTTRPAQSSKFDGVCPSLGSFPSIQSTRPGKRFSTYLPKQHNGRFVARSSFDLTAFVVGCFFLLHLCHLRELRCVVVKHLLALFVASYCLCLVALTCQAPSASRAVTSLIVPAPPLPSSLLPLPLPLPVRLPPRSTTTNNSSNLVTSSLTLVLDFCRSA